MDKTIQKEWLTISIIIFLGALIRFFNVGELAVFLADQAIDSYAVKQILEGNLTLLGPRASVGQFFNGPIVYYLMLPWYAVMSADPLAGTIFQIMLQLFAMPFLYLIGKRFGGSVVGYAALLLFAFSPLLIWYSRATFNSYPAIPFGIFILYVLTTLPFSRFSLVVAGILMGMFVQMHYFLYAFAGIFLLYILFVSAKKIHSTFWSSLGLIIGLAPFLIFELRHNFFNIRGIVSMGQSTDSVGLWERLLSIGMAFGSLIGLSNGVLGLITLVCVSIMFIKLGKNHYRVLYALGLLTTVTLSIFYRGYMQTHYLIGFMPIFILGFATIWAKLFPKNGLLVLGIIMIIVIMYQRNELFAIAKYHDGISIQDTRRIVETIKRWKTNSDSWNVTQDAQQDNRAMPIRYLLSLDKSIAQPLPVEDYQSNRELFIVALRDKPLREIDTWEVQSFGDNYTIIEKTEINKKYILYYLRRR